MWGCEPMVCNLGSGDERPIFPCGLAVSESAYLNQMGSLERQKGMYKTEILVVFTVGVLMGLVYKHPHGFVKYLPPPLSDVLLWIDAYSVLYMRQRWVTSTVDLITGSSLNSELQTVMMGCLFAGCAVALKSPLKPQALGCLRSFFALSNGERQTDGAHWKQDRGGQPENTYLQGVIDKRWRGHRGLVGAGMLEPLLADHH